MADRLAEGAGHQSLALGSTVRESSDPGHKESSMRRFTATSLALSIAATGLMLGSAAAASPRSRPTSKIGLVTDVGTLDDKSFNQYSYEGAVNGAAALGAEEPPAAISLVSTDIAPNIQAFVDQGYDIIVTVGFAAGEDTANHRQGQPGHPSSSASTRTSSASTRTAISTAMIRTRRRTRPTCPGDAAALLPNRVGIGWHEEEPGYLAGIVAAHISKTGVIAAVGGTNSVPAVPNYIIGFENGAKSVNPDIEVITYYVSPAPDAKAFNDPAQGKSDASQLLAFFPDIDVFFQVAGKTGNGVLEAACEAGIYGIGVDVDQFVSAPEYQDCIVVSAEKKLSKNVSDMIVKVAEGTEPSGGVKLGIDTDDVGLSPFHDFESQVTPELQADLDAAIAGLKDGSIQACELSPFQSCVQPAE